ncbi:DUF2306 domain-containing protein [Oscillatoria amoena NRMC-F 0135]|nr:DUF2306 domain-containing protein [Oscillatoria amoena NRMC-F 0135]
MKKFTFVLIAFFAVAIGLYPFAYVLADMSMGLLATKPADLLQDKVWRVAFHVHIFLGGVSLLAGWSQFSRVLRNRNLGLHRLLGKVYLVSVLLSGVAGLYIAFYASAGVIAATGFGFLAIGWLFTSAMAYRHIRNRNIDAHQHWMIRSYALTFAAVTLRIWLPLMDFAMGMDFFDAYRIVAWLCWVPNALIAEIIIRKVQREPVTV